MKKYIFIKDDQIVHKDDFPDVFAAIAFKNLTWPEGGVEIWALVKEWKPGELEALLNETSGEKDD